MNAAQVRAKARAAMKRREDEIEQDEIEGGEINLIPYLDIVTNLMLFLLASISAGLILGQLNTTLPDQGPPQSAMDSPPDQDPSQKPLKLIVAVTKAEIYVTSLTGLEGGELGRPFTNPKATIPRGQDTAGDDAIPTYDYGQLNAALYEIAARRWKGKERQLATFQIRLMVDNDIPYGTIVAIMDALRCKLPPPDQAGVSCMFPSDEQAIQAAPEPEDTLSNIYDPGRVAYDPDRHALFHDIIFSRL